MVKYRRGILASLAGLAGMKTVSASTTEYPAWERDGVYTNGDRVIYSGYIWEAHWWTSGDEPHDTTAVWNRIGSVSDEHRYPVWSSDGVYRTGNRVVYDGYVWEAQWWSEGDEPLDTADVWDRIRAVSDTANSDEDKVNDEEPADMDDESPVGPEGEWSLVFDEQWSELNDDRWAVGFIDHEDWIPDDDASVSADHVTVADGQCILEIESTGNGPEGCYQGVINSSVGGENWHPSTGVPITPTAGEGGQYMEARMKMPGRTGILPAFWGHTADTTWPPEIDVVELFQYGDDAAAEQRTLHANAHWTASTEPGDMESHEHNPYSVDTGVDLTETFNTFGCAWYSDRIEWYFNGERILTRDGPDAMLETLNDEGSHPFGLIFSNHVNRMGEANLDEAWTEEMIIDWVRVWEFSGDTSTESDSTEWYVLDDFANGKFDSGWIDTGHWETTDALAASGSHSAFTGSPYSRLSWDGELTLSRGSTLQFQFAFDDSSSQQLNCSFGQPTDTSGGYRLDIHRDEIAVLDTGNDWKWLGGDGSYENGTTNEWHTAEISFTETGISITVEGDVAGAIEVRDSQYDGDGFHFEIDTGGVYIDEIRVTDR